MRLGINRYLVNLALLAGALLFSAGAGPVFIPPGTVGRILADQLPGISLQADWIQAFETILRKIRLPHTALMALAGSALATSGAAYQGVFRNPLADPYLIGVASGAGLGNVGETPPRSLGNAGCTSSPGVPAWFDFGQEVLKKRITQAQFPILGANVEGIDNVKPYIIKQLNGVNVAIIGLLTDETPVSTHPKNVSGIHFYPPAEVLPNYIAELRQKADLFVVLSHIGYSSDRILAGKVPGIDIIAGGHSHTKLVQPVKVENTLVLQAWEHEKPSECLI